MNSARHVYSPGSVDSWDMENLRFLRKISQGRNCFVDGNGSDVDTLSYVSDNDSAVYDDRAVDESEDEKGDDDASSNMYGGRVDHRDDDNSEYGMSSNESEVQSPTRLLDEALYCGGNGFALLNKAIVMKQMKSMAASTLKDPYLEDEAESDIIEPLPVIRSRCTAPGVSPKRHGRGEETGNFDRRFMKSRKPKPSLVTLGFMEPQLEDCYVLDVVTVRNESVLAERGRVDGSLCALSDSQDSESEGMGKMLKLNGSSRRNGSAGLPSSSSSSVSSDEFNSAREGFFPSSADDDPIQIHHRESSPAEVNRAASCSPVSVVVRGECTSRIPVEYPLEAQSSDRSFETASSNYYYLGQQHEDFEQLGHSHKHNGDEIQGKDSLRMVEVESPRSISPYYVRLRRDLIPPSYTPPHPRQPWNFGMNRQGLLVIDYSPNWDGLETYVRNLSLQSSNSNTYST